MNECRSYLDEDLAQRHSRIMIILRSALFMNVARTADSFLDSSFFSGHAETFKSSFLIRSSKLYRVSMDFWKRAHSGSLYYAEPSYKSGYTIILVVRTRITFGIQSMRTIKARLSEDSLVGYLVSRFNVQYMCATHASAGILKEMQFSPAECGQ